MEWLASENYPCHPWLILSGIPVALHSAAVSVWHSNRQNLMQHAGKWEHTLPACPLRHPAGKLHRAAGMRPPLLCPGRTDWPPSPGIRQGCRTRHAGSARSHFPARVRARCGPGCRCRDFLHSRSETPCPSVNASAFLCGCFPAPTSSSACSGIRRGSRGPPA